MLIHWIVNPRPTPFPQKACEGNILCGRAHAANDQIPMKKLLKKECMKIPSLAIGLAALLLTSCSIVDPNNIIGRSGRMEPPETSPVPLPSTAWKREAIDVVFDTVQTRYYDPALNGVDWAAARRTYEPLLLAAKTDDEFWELLDKFTGVLKDSHTRVHSPKDVQNAREQEVHALGIALAEIEGKILVTGVNGDSDAYFAGVRSGMTVTHIEGEPALTYVRKLEASVRETSTPWTRRRVAFRKLLSGDVDSKISMHFARVGTYANDGGEIIATLKRRSFGTGSDATARTLPSGYGYIRFSGFSLTSQSRVLAGIEKLKDTPGLIIDLRNNGGGLAAAAQAITMRFFTEDKFGAKALTRDGKPITIWFYPVIPINPVLKANAALAYTKPLVILTNESSASASELMTSLLQDFGRATIVGQRTCGCLLGYIGLMDLPGGGQMAYSEIGYRSPKGKRIEGEGVTPDIAVALTADDIITQRDRSLEAAEAHLTAVTRLTKDEKK